MKQALGIFMALLVIAGGLNAFNDGWLRQKDRPRVHLCTFETENHIKVSGQLTKVSSHSIICIPLNRIYREEIKNENSH